MVMNISRSTWRLIISDSQAGSINMAQDAAILAAVEKNEAPPTLRLYRWDPACLSLGYSQPAADVDQNRLAEHGWDLVRRPTGGKAILHTDELTYSIIGPKTDPRLEGSLMDSYRRISQALFYALQELGLPVKIHQGKNPLAHHQPVCFENPSDFEITVGGKKIIGSAQARKKQAILQHGSLPLGGDLTRITKVLRYPSEQDREAAAKTLLEKGQTVAGVLGEDVPWEQAARIFVNSFQEVLNLDLRTSELTPSERQNRDTLLQEKFGNPSWTLGDHLKSKV